MPPVDVRLWAGGCVRMVEAPGGADAAGGVGNEELLVQLGTWMGKGGRASVLLGGARHPVLNTAVLSPASACSRVVSAKLGACW